MNEQAKYITEVADMLRRWDESGGKRNGRKRKFEWAGGIALQSHAFNKYKRASNVLLFYGGLDSEARLSLAWSFGYRDTVLTAEEVKAGMDALYDAQQQMTLADMLRIVGASKGAVGEVGRTDGHGAWHRFQLSGNSLLAISSDAFSTVAGYAVQFLSMELGGVYCGEVDEAYRVVIGDGGRLDVSLGAVNAALSSTNYDLHKERVSVFRERFVYTGIRSPSRERTIAFLTAVRKRLIKELKI